MHPRSIFILSALFLSTRTSHAQLDSLSGTIEGALHECEYTGLAFFNTGGGRPLSALFLPSSRIPDFLRSGTTTFEAASKYNPLLTLTGITIQDGAYWNFDMSIETGEVFEVSSFSLCLVGDGTRVRDAYGRQTRSSASCLMDQGKHWISRERL